MPACHDQDGQDESVPVGRAFLDLILLCFFQKFSISAQAFSSRNASWFVRFTFRPNFLGILKLSHLKWQVILISSFSLKRIGRLCLLYARAVPSGRSLSKVFMSSP